MAKAVAQEQVPTQILETPWVYKWDPVWRLLEVKTWHKPSNSFHRGQHLWVIRDDRVFHYLEDLGPWEGHSFQILALGDHTVEECRSMANDNRNDDHWTRFINEETEASTLISDIIKQAERNEQVVANRSNFGYGGHTQRNGFSQKVREKLERRKGKKY